MNKYFQGFDLSDIIKLGNYSFSKLTPLLFRLLLKFIELLIRMDSMNGFSDNWDSVDDELKKLNFLFHEQQ